MSQPIQVQLPDVKEWLSKETEGLIEPLQSKAENFVNETKDRIDDAVQSSEKILENSQNEMNKNNSKTYRFARNANKFAQNITEAINRVTIPTEFTYDKIQSFCGDLEKALGTAEQLRRGAYPYISPYFIFDRRRLDVSLKRLYDVTKDLGKFLTDKYAEVKTVEDANPLVDKLIQAINETKQNQNRTTTAEERARILEERLAETHNNIVQIKARAELNDLLKVTQGIEELTQNVKHSLRYLQKPFFKLHSLSRTSEVTIPLHELKKLEEYLNDPYMALATEQDGFPTLKSILSKLDMTISQGKLKLKSARIRKAQDQMNTILNKDSLLQLQRNCREALNQKEKLSTSQPVTALQNRLGQLQNQLRESRRESELANSKVKALRDEQAKLRERTEHLKKELENNILQLTDKNVQVALPV